MKKLLLIYNLLFSIMVCSQSNLENKLKTHVKVLSSENFNGRKTGTAGEKLALNYIQTKIKNKKFGITTQRFNFSTNIKGNHVNTFASNLFSFIDNKKDSTIVLCAHYDHLGVDSIGLSYFKGNPVLHPGADDNASSVSILIELYRSLLKNKKYPHNYLILLPSAEELGSVGADTFCQNFLLNYRIKMVLNFDLTGRFKPENKYKFYCLDTSDLKIQEQIKKSDTDSLFYFSSNCPEISDHISFKKRGIKSFFITSGIHEDFHKPTDTYEKLNYTKMAQLHNVLLRFLSNL